jgi:hypothetical protein
MSPVTHLVLFVSPLQTSSTCASVKEIAISQLDTDDTQWVVDEAGTTRSGGKTHRNHFFGRGGTERFIYNQSQLAIGERGGTERWRRRIAL